MKVDKCDHLSSISGMVVWTYKDELRNRDVFVFRRNNGSDVTSFYDYKKAKAFAMGVAYGKHANI